MNIMGWLALIILGLVAIYYFMIWVMNRNKSIQNKEIMDDVVAKAMASKIAFNAKKHRKNQEKYNYIKSDNDKE
jgi:beta-lactam-binding protein with PASTA domain